MIVGSIVMATRRTGVCEPGEIGVVYELYQDFDVDGGRAVSVIFSSGRYDGFSVAEQRHMLSDTGLVDPFLAAYQFRNVMQLDLDFERGLFDNALRGRVRRNP